jgi:prolyl-tRNA editing enzyme YbaK/EbsC (Cys-tRNA(Pro) deacylase)
MAHANHFFSMNEIQNQIESNSLYLFLQENNIEGKLVQSFDNLLLDAIYVKSLIWECKSKSICYVLVLLADDRIDTNLVVKALNAESRSDVCLASRSLAIEMSGYLLGCVPPLGHRKKMPIILDSALVSKVNEMSDDGLHMYICGGGGQVGFELLIDLNEILNLDYSSVEEISDKSPMKRKSIESKIIKTLKTKFTENSKPSISQFRRAAMAGDNESLATIISHIGDKGVVKAMLNLPSTEGGKTALHLAAW